MSATPVDPRRLLAGRLMAISDDGLTALEARLDLIARSAPVDMTRQAATSDRDRRYGSGATGPTAIVRVHGVLLSRETWWSRWLDTTSYDMVRAQIREALGDRDVKAILLDIDSPGGDVAGLEETAALLRQARTQKPVVAVVGSLMASAALYLGSQATELHASPSALVGSLGTVMVHVDTSELEANIGVRYTYIHAGKYKVEGNPHEPLPSDAKAYMQREWIDPAYRRFVEDVALGRGLTPAAVESRFGQGRMYGAPEALRRGMVDHITAYDDVVSDVTSRGRIFQRVTSGRRAATDDEHERLRRWLTIQEMELQVAANGLEEPT